MSQVKFDETNTAIHGKVDYDMNITQFVAIVQVQMYYKRRL